METSLNVFYHLFCVNNGLEIFLNSYKKMENYNLLENVDNVFVNCVGKKQKEFSKEIKNLNKVKINLGKNDKNESETINMLRDFSIDNNGYSLYLHAKGAWRSKQSNVNPVCIQSLVDCLEFFVIEKYYHCVKLLEKNKSCGPVRCINYKNNKNSGHYGGNFWWARNDYIASLPRCEDTRKAPESFINCGIQPGNTEHTDVIPDVNLISKIKHTNTKKRRIFRKTYESKIDF